MGLFQVVSKMRLLSADAKMKLLDCYELGR
jgi:hypothetical protein